MDKSERLKSSQVFSSLPKKEQEYIVAIGDRLRLSMQYLHQLCEAAADLSMWDEGPLERHFSPLLMDLRAEKRSGTARNALIMGLLKQKLDALRNEEIDYRSFEPRRSGAVRHILAGIEESGSTLLGTCPVAGEKTRCCNLLTLDAVMQCGYACSYCSIQSFYDDQTIQYYSNLDQRLKELGAALDHDTTYHIGTGQSSDSLMFSNHGGILDALISFARENPQIILELKTKSGNITYLSEYPGNIPANIICTWSLNPQLIIEKEEHLSASLETRLDAARKAADRGILVGFHFHHIIRYLGWEKGYSQLVNRVTRRFSPEETVMVSLGTLTFIKPVLRKLRTMGIRSKVLRIPLAEASGKYSYPLEIKQQLFSHVYDSFPETWKRKVFFYLCMEPGELWEPVFGFSYRDNREFEEAMKQSYREKITRHGS